jgi:hypothetical protein
MVKFNRLRRVVERLLRYDPGIVEVVQFGFSVYAPRYARYVDLLVITRDVRKYDCCLDVSNPEDAPFNVDVLVFEVGKSFYT